MLIKSMRRIVLIAALGMQMLSCEYNVEAEEMQLVGVCDPVISYVGVIRPLIDNNCMPCHNGDGSQPFAPNLMSYNAVESIASLVKEVTQSRRMPKSGSITDAEIEAIKCWVDNGALNN